MQRWHEELEAAGIHADAAYTDSAAVPVAATGCTLLLDDSLLYVRRADGLPFVLDAASVSEALDVALPPPQTGEAHAGSAEHVTFYTSAEAYEAHRDLIEGLRDRTASLAVKLLPEGPLPVLAAVAAGGAGINLLQGPFSARAALGTRLRPWRIPAALAAGVALLFLVNQGVSWWQDHRSEKSLDAQIAQLFSEVLPNQPIVDPRAQIQGVLGQGAGGPGLLPAMSALAEAIAQTPSAKIEAMSFRGDALELRLTAPTVESLDGIKQAIGRNGIDAELQSATPRGGVVEGRLQLKLRQA
jgi:general secretion pathway protein L